jgi:RND family efflux transporter MFP subunit
MATLSRVRAGAFALLLAPTLIALGCNRHTPAPPAKEPPDVEFATPVYDTVSDYEDFTGRTEGIPMVEVRARVSGELVKVHFTDGDEVKEGDPLFDIDPRLFEDERDRAKATLSQTDASFARKKKLLDRAKVLRIAGTNTVEDLENAGFDYDEAKASRDQAAANLKNAELNLEFCHVRAPQAGRTSRKKIDVGNQVTANVTPLTTIVALDPMFANFDMDERTLIRLRKRIQKKELPSIRVSKMPVLIGLADEEGYSLQGSFEFAENMLDAGTGTLRMRVKIENPERGTRRLLSPNMFVRVRFPVGIPHKALLVPEEALVSDQGIRHLFVLDANNKVQDRRVKLGQLQGELRVIEEGLTPTDRVIVRGQQRVRAGVEVKPREVKKDTYLVKKDPPPAGK